MGSKFGHMFGMPYGDHSLPTNNINAHPMGHNTWGVQTTPIAIPADYVYILAVDGKPYGGRIRLDDFILMGIEGESPILEIIQMPAGYSDPAFFESGWFSETIIDNKLLITWDPPADVSNVEGYNLYWDDGDGTVIFDDAHKLNTVLIVEDGSGSYEFHQLITESGTYKVVVVPVDSAGNEEQGGGELVQIITIYPKPVTGIEISYNAGDQKVTITWTDPAEGFTLRVYDNAGSLTDLFPDYTSIRDTTPTSAATWLSGALANGIWVFGLRVYDGTNEEPNTCCWVVMRIESGIELSDPPPKPILETTERADGVIRLQAICNPYIDDDFTGIGIPTKVKFFKNDGAGGAVDYNTPLGGDFVTLTQIAGLRIAMIDTAALPETAHVFGLIAYSTNSVASIKADEVTATPKSTDPPQALNAAITTGRN